MTSDRRPKTVETWTANGHAWGPGDFDPSTPVGYIAWKLSLAASVHLADKASMLDFYHRMATQLVAHVATATHDQERRP